MRFLIQTFIHKIEEAGGMRYLRSLLALVAVVLVVVVYNLYDFKNFSTQEAMDAAQLGRNLARGRGYTTLFVRPFSMYLLQRVNQQNPGAPTPGQQPDFARIKSAHPDIANPPVYPVVLAGLMKALPFRYDVNITKPFWSIPDMRSAQTSGRKFWRHEPDFLIAVFNELLLLAVIVAAFFWARRLFDPAVAWTSAVLLFGTELLWRFSISGLSTLLLLFIFMSLVWCLTLWEAEARESKRGDQVLLVLAAAAGLLVGIGGLTRYAFAWMIIPTLIFVIGLAKSRRGLFGLITLVAFVAVMAPWIARNYNLSGTPFGTATYAVLQDTGNFTGNRLERSLSPDLQFFIPALQAKLLANSRAILQSPFSSLGGGWIAGFFLVGLLVGFRNPAIRRMRYFLVSSLALLIVVQALGRTQLSDDSPEINSENLLPVLLPLVVIYGVSLFFLLLDQINFPIPELRPVAVGAFGFLACLPMIFALWPPGTSPVAYPPYHPLVIQQTAAWIKEDEWIMSDIPWAVAWYGDRQSVWLTLNATADPKNSNSQENFYTIDYFHKPINALYLTPKTLDERFVSGWIRAGEYSWGDFIVNTVLKNQVPPDFPLRQMPSGYLPEQLFLSDWKRWQ